MTTVSIKVTSTTTISLNYTVTNVDNEYTRCQYNSVVFANSSSSGLPRAYTLQAGTVYMGFFLGTSVPKGTKSKTMSLWGLTRVIPRSHTAQSVAETFKLSFYSDDGKYSFDKTAAFSWTVSAKPSYTVSYAANYGSSTPSSQTQWYNEPLKLANAISRSGYTFYEWKATNGDGYLAGGTYMKNAATTMTAQWNRTLTYDANGGTNAPGSQTALSTTAITITNTKPTRTGYRFLGWSTTSTGIVQYPSGGTYGANNPSIKLYAVWGAMITSIRAQRCDTQGNLDDEGTCMLLEVGWNKSPNAPSDAPTLSLSSTPSVTMPTPTLSGTEGLYSVVVQQQFDSDTKYTIQAVLADNITSHTATALLDTAFFTMDVLAGGHGVCFGGPAKQEVFEVDMPQAAYSQRCYPNYTTSSMSNYSLPSGCDGAFALDLANMIPYFVTSSGKNKIFSFIKWGHHWWSCNNKLTASRTWYMPNQFGQTQNGATNDTAFFQNDTNGLKCLKKGHVVFFVTGHQNHTVANTQYAYRLMNYTTGVKPTQAENYYHAPTTWQHFDLTGIASVNAGDIVVVQCEKYTQDTTTGFGPTAGNMIGIYLDWE